jgi:FlaG/FlaF family flagellin (archaellin)
MNVNIQRKKRLAVSPVIATLLLIAIAVAAAIIVYAFVTGLIGGLTSSSGSNLIAATATLTIPSGTTNGVLVISVTNNANNPVTGIQVVYTNMEDSNLPAALCMGQTPAAAGVGCDLAGIQPCGSLNAVAGKNVPFCNEVAGVATAISTGNALQVGGQISSSENVIGIAGVTLQSGNTYSMTLTVDFANGGTHTQALSATGEL